MHELDRKAVLNGVIAALLLVAAIYFGSGRLVHLDPALIAYTSACIFATFGIVYRYSVWLQRPPTLLYWLKGSRLLLQPARLPGNILWLVRLFWDNFVVQRFIEKRSHLRWASHFLISWGCIVAGMVTFPLVLGWVYTWPHPGRPDTYDAYALGLRVATFPGWSVAGWLSFHVLDFCAIAVLVGIALAFRRRLYDPGALAVQQFAMDFLPLILLFTICVTGLMLTASGQWFHGNSYSFIALLHAFTVIVTILYLPFGKFFHVFQRPAQIGVQFYKREGARTKQAVCRRCHQPYASAMQVEDLKWVLHQLELDQRLSDQTHYQEICPRCRRVTLALNQQAAIGEHGFL